jgi:bifunctional DNA-binding transcriptional regulator/antitoxin component of YhaV-PrlF toxin-antitoxin module
MSSLIIERERLVKLMEEWLAESKIKEGDRLEITFQSNEVIIRPQSKEQVNLRRWLDRATRKYDTVLKRLATS